MENERFEKLLIALKGKDIWDVRLEECKAIIKELVNSDFGDIRYGLEKIFIQIARLPSGKTMAMTIEDKKPGQFRIIIEKANWERNPDFGKTGLRMILAHELLHVETGLEDRDPRFKQAARERGIDIWRV